ncbi:unnamed protein product [Rotaria magnacalcarata]|uniref:Uncharacterized protein n=2 Tax=Rotaria magnacalcarata TaxID=392030 RepID=A0A815ZST7_9BILA|nr:unnamed protein product [Rotaria magnacalcarata]CAF1587135.1 unnamed protein product [Rotaria magnacalcarata]CAF2119258.1 unnamed protein product [Rotaria magnacalcarata]CAF2185859.1 unnamed protein product [Rotaria magnacalcarata]CAF4341954.1 unnamed protein product [Rotaria magnacalcarata]
MKSKNSVRKNNFHPNDHSTPKTKFNPDNILYKEPNQPINIIDNDNKQINDNINKNQLELTSIQSNSNSSKKLLQLMIIKFDAFMKKQDEQNERIDDLKKLIDDSNKRFDHIDNRLNHIEKQLIFKNKLNGTE